MRALFEKYRHDGGRLLSEPHGFSILAALGVEVPASLVVERVEELDSQLLRKLPGEPLVLKVISPDLTHKTEVGGVTTVDRDVEALRRAAVTMAAGLGDRLVQGYLLQECVERSEGSELIVGWRLDREFGPLMSVGLGGRAAELWARDLRPDRGLAVVPITPELTADEVATALAPLTITDLLTRSQRGRSPVITLARLAERLRDLALGIEPLFAEGLEEMEVNPLAVRRGELIALDVLARVAETPLTVAPDRPIGKLRSILEPRSIALVGVSKRRNIGRRILENLLEQGFDPNRVRVVKRGEESLLGCRCVPEVGALPETVDLLIVAIAAAGVPALLEKVIAGNLAEGVLLIPGGLGETEASRESVEALSAALQRARSRAAGGPVINGGNCMGIRSIPGGYDTFFLPRHKMPPLEWRGARTALIAQSGAFLAARSSRWETIPLRYSISIGNQLDLTASDYLRYLEGDPEVRVVALYLEGLKNLDGRRLLETARRLHNQGRTVVLYRAGRSEAGQRAAASHTAAIAGSYRVTEAVARSAGIMLADSMRDFDNLVSLASAFEDRAPLGRQLGGLSNAGFECVALSDRLGWFESAMVSSETERKLKALLERGGVGELVEVRNPLDLTPMIGDELYGEIVEALLDDPAVDVGVIGCVPLTGALETLPASEAHGEDLTREGAIAARLIELWRCTRKPWVVVVDAGPTYDPLVGRLREAGIPTFRRMDEALRTLATLARYHASLGEVADAKADQG